MSTALAQVASRLSVSEQELQSIVMNTVMPNGGKQVTNDQFVSFMAIANEYRLNPLVKQIYAFPAQGGGIQPIVSIDGWLSIINSQKDFNGMTFEDIRENGELLAVTCRIYKKGTEYPVEVTEYMGECRRNTPTWKQYPARMLRHKATIQAGRYAFGISGIIDPDEAERFEDAGVIQKPVEKDITPKSYPQNDFDENFPKWEAAIRAGKKTPEQIIALVGSKGELTNEMIDAINNIQIEDAA
jgi:phage recombination protein Bet